MPEVTPMSLRHQLRQSRKSATSAFAEPCRRLQPQLAQPRQISTAFSSKPIKSARLRLSERRPGSQQSGRGQVTSATTFVETGRRSYPPVLKICYCQSRLEEFLLRTAKLTSRPDMERQLLPGLRSFPRRPRKDALRPTATFTVTPMSAKRRSLAFPRGRLEGGNPPKAVDAIGEAIGC